MLTNNPQDPHAIKSVNLNIRRGLWVVIGIIIIFSLIVQSYSFAPFINPNITYSSNRIWLNYKARTGNRDEIYDAAVKLYQMKQSYEDVDLAHEWYRKAAEKGHPSAICLLANTEGWGFYDKKWIEIGARLKIEGCLYRLAQAYDFGMSGYPKNAELALKLNTECNHISQLRDKLPYELRQKGSLNGIEVEARFEQYQQELETKFNSGHPEVGMQLFRFFQGLDNDMAISWLRRGAELNPVCAKQLADLYQDGACGLPQDKDAFYHWFLHSRELENQQAKTNK